MTSTEYLVYDDSTDDVKYVDGPDTDDHDTCAEFANFLDRNGFAVLRIRDGRGAGSNSPVRPDYNDPRS